jgi:hypothetical protein
LRSTDPRLDLNFGKAGLAPAFLFLPERFQAKARAALDAGMKTGSRQETAQCAQIFPILLTW